MGLPVSHFQILARDRARLQDFYAELFGWSIQAEDEMDFAMVETGSDQGIGGTIVGADAKFGVTIALESDDPEAVAARAAALGGKITEPVREIPDRAKVGRITEPSGLEVGIFQDLGGEMASSGSSGKAGPPIVHFEFHSSDSEPTQEFFIELGGWKVDSSNPMNYGLVDTGSGAGINGGITPAQEGPAGGAGIIVYAEVDDLQAYLDRAESLGGKTVMPVTEIPDMVTLAMFTDPEGNRFGLVKSDAH